MQVIGHHNELLQARRGEMPRYLDPARSNDFSKWAQDGTPVINPAENIPALRRANCNEIRPRLRIISPLQPNRPAMQLFLFSHSASTVETPPLPLSLVGARYIVPSSRPVTLSSKTLNQTSAIFLPNQAGRQMLARNLQSTEPGLHRAHAFHQILENLPLGHPLRSRSLYYLYATSARLSPIPTFQAPLALPSQFCPQASKGLISNP